MLGDFSINLPKFSTSPPQIVLGIRPEHVRVALPEDTQTVKGKVFLVENLGMYKLVSVRIPSSQIEPLTVRALLPPDQNWANEEITLALPFENIHWFDVDSGDGLQ